MTLRAFSSGGGVQSIAALVLSAEGHIDYPIHLFCNTGDDSEHPATLRYVREVAMPYAAAHGIAFEELHRVKRDGTPETLYGRMMRQGGRSQTIPVRLSSGAPGTRSCTSDFKIRVIAKRLKQLGATKVDPAISGLGISLDEFQRARTDSGIPHQRLEYPLIALRLTRSDCVGIIRGAGLPVPPKSACWFCPFHGMKKWQEMRHEEPELFWKAVDLEQHLSHQRSGIGKDAVWLTRKLIPLDKATSANRTLPMFSMNEKVSGEDAARILSGEIVYGKDFGILDDAEDDACEGGYCMT